VPFCLFGWTTKGGGKSELRNSRRTCESKRFSSGGEGGGIASDLYAGHGDRRGGVGGCDIIPEGSQGRWSQADDARGHMDGHRDGVRGRQGRQVRVQRQREGRRRAHAPREQPRRVVLHSHFTPHFITHFTSPFLARFT